MAKQSSNPNPLKYFNDERAKRVAKAQKGLQTDSTNYYKTKYDKAVEDAYDNIEKSSPQSLTYQVKSSAERINNAKKEYEKYIQKTKKKAYGGPTEKESPTDTYKRKVSAGEKEGWKVDQPGAYKAGLTDTASVTYLRKGKEFAGVRKPKNK